MEVVLESEPEVTVDALEQRLAGCRRLKAQITAIELDTLRRLSRCEVATLDGARSMKEWLAARADISGDTAGELIRAASLLEAHPDLEARLLDGDSSFDRVMATAKLREAGASDEVVAASAGHDIAGVRRMATRHRRMTRRGECEAHERRFVRLQPALDGMGGSVWADLPSTGFTVLEKALHQCADELPEPPDRPHPLQVRMADALVSLCQDSLDRDAPENAGASPAVTVFVDAALAAPSRGEAGAVVAGNGLRVGPATLAELLCEGTVGVVGLRQGTPVATTPRQRAIPPAIRDHVLDRDAGCTIDGCTSRYRLQPHHVMAFTSGGTHEPRNLTTLCWYHHHVVVHQRGYTIDPSSSPQRRRLLPPQYDDP